MAVCGACSHPDTQRLEEWCAATPRRSNGAIGAEFGLDHHVIQRHRKDQHFKPKGGPTEPLILEGDVDPVQSLQKQLNDLDRINTLGWTPNQIDRLHEQKRRVAESLARARPPTTQEGATAAQLKRAEEMLRIYSEVTQRHPDLREEVRTALHEWARTQRTPVEMPA